MTYWNTQTPSQAGRRRTGRFCGPSTMQFSLQDREQPMIYSNAECPMNSSSCVQVEDISLQQYRSWAGPKESRSCERVLVGLPTARDSAMVFPDGHIESMPVKKTMCVGKYPSLCMSLAEDNTLIAYQPAFEMYKWVGPNDGPATL